MKIKCRTCKNTINPEHNKANFKILGYGWHYCPVCRKHRLHDKTKES